MRINVFNLIIFILFNVITSLQTQQARIVKVKTEKGPGGIWKSTVIWKPHWVKHWEIRKMWVPVLKKVWAPVETKEWIPLPPPPKKQWSQKHSPIKK